MRCPGECVNGCIVPLKGSILLSSFCASTSNSHGLWFYAVLGSNRSRWGAGARLGKGEEHFGSTGRHYWYAEHDVDTDQLGFEDYNLDKSEQRYQGAIVACSTNDMLSWRNEGAMVRLGLRSMTPPPSPFPHTIPFN